MMKYSKFSVPFLRVVALMLVLALVLGGAPVSSFATGGIIIDGEDGNTTDGSGIWADCQVITVENDEQKDPVSFEVYRNENDLLNVAIVVENGFLSDAVQLEVSVYDEGGKDPIFADTAGIGKEVLEIPNLAAETQYRIHMLASVKLDFFAYSGYFEIVTKEDILEVEYELTQELYRDEVCGTTIMSELQMASELVAELAVEDPGVEAYDLGTETDEALAAAQALITSAELASIRYEQESNNTMALADTVVSDDTAYGKIGYATDVDYYKVKFTSAGKANFWLGDIPYGKDYDMYLYNSSGTELASSRGTSNQEQIYGYAVSANTWYYVKIVGYNGAYSQSYRYRFRAKNYPYGIAADAYETNNTSGTATAISNNTTISDATIHNTGDVDFFKFTLTEASYVDITMSNIKAGCDYDLVLYNGVSSAASYSQNGSNKSESISVQLPAGTHRIKVYSYSGYSSTKYRLTVSSRSVITPDSYETNNTMGTATAASVSNTYCGNIHTASDRDYYSFTLQSKMTVEIELTDIPSGCDYDLKLLNSNGGTVSKSEKGGSQNEKISTLLQPGRYYVVVYTYRNVAAAYYRLGLLTYVPVVFGDFSRNLETPVIPDNVQTARAGIAKEYNKWPAEPPSEFEDEDPEIRIDDLNAFEGDAYLTIQGGEALGLDIAVEYLSHFMENTGHDMEIDVCDLVASDNSATKCRNDKFNMALEAAEMLGREGDSITFSSTKYWLLTPSTLNWRSALGTCSVTIKCTVQQTGNQYSALITLHVYDVYDWDVNDYEEGSKPLSPHEAWELNHGGYGKCFYSYGVYSYNVSWRVGQRIGSGAVITAGGDQ